MNTQYVMMPKELSRADSEALFHSYGIGDADLTYKYMVEVLSQPVPDHGWNDALRTAMGAIRDVNDRMSDSARDALEDSCEAVEALLDQQPKPLVTLKDDNLAESLAAKFGRNGND